MPRGFTEETRAGMADKMKKAEERAAHLAAARGGVGQPHEVCSNK